MKEYDVIEVELNKTIKHLDWLIIQPEFFDIVSGNKNIWHINKIRLIAVKQWLDATIDQVDAKLTVEELDGYKGIEESLQVNKY